MAGRSLGAPLLFCVLFLVTGLLGGCGSQASGGDQTIIQSPNVVSGVTVRVNNVTGSDVADGLVQPYETLQHAINQLRPGDTLLIEDTGTAYSTSAIIAEERDENNVLLRNLRGFSVTTSGTTANPIRIVGEGPGRPVIDQMRNTSDANDAFMGILLDCASHVVIQNIEIRNVNEAAISSSINGACETSGIIVEDNVISNVYGQKYVGGVRMMGVSDLVIRNNQISAVFSNQEIETKTLNKNARGVESLLIEGNEFDSVDIGVGINAQGIGSATFALNAPETISGLQIASNRFTNVANAISFDQHIADALVADELSTGNFSDVDVYGNVFDSVDTALSVNVGDGENQSNSVCFFNNTTVGSALEAVAIEGLTGTEIFNNIFVQPQGEIILTTAPGNASLQNGIAYSDNQLFWDFVGLNWRLGSGGSDDTAYADLVAWQAASGHPELSVDPALSSLAADPLFVDSINADYSLQATSPAALSGRFGMSIGADFSLPAGVESITNPCIERIR